jgi:hypothetical protein
VNACNTSEWEAFADLFTVVYQWSSERILDITPLTFIRSGFPTGTSRSSIR